MRGSYIFRGYDLSEENAKKIFSYVEDEDKDCFQYYFAEKINNELKLKYKYIELYYWPCCWYNERMVEGESTFVIGYKSSVVDFDGSCVIDVLVMFEEKINKELNLMKDDLKLSGSPKVFCLPDDCYYCT
jgi:hypothetical protein